MATMKKHEVLGLDLSRLYREPVFTSQSKEKSHQLLSNNLVDHDLYWREGTVDTAFFHATIGCCDIFALRYGAEVEVHPKPFTDFVLIQTPLHGSASIQCDGAALEVKPGQLLILAPSYNVRLTWHSGCEQLIVKVPRSLLQSTWETLISEDSCTEEVSIPSLFHLEGRQGTRGLRLISELLDQLTNENEAPPQWRHHLEVSLATFILTHKPSTDIIPSPSLGDRKLKLLAKRVDTVMRNRLTTHTTLSKLSSECGASVRNLNNICRKLYDKSPMEHMRNLRLEAARKSLLNSQSLSVTEVALTYRFTHLGRFSNYYYERFGELPRQTLAHLFTHKSAQ
ncbi:AraC family transcriptional regulator [Oceanisphaera ostreae]|uniref:AraC family transcriptional regulator n=1 Tax=Oceanisphaera ostreae TaxID=914151 RepID=A0ABW3KHD2_9GAMM